MRFFILAAILVALFVFIADALGAPKKGEWVCWYTATTDSSCGTYSWNKKRSHAERQAAQLCTAECESSCVLDYCEKL
jgi:hypothetical protein